MLLYDSLELLLYSFPSCLKPCGFSRPGNFYGTFKTEGTRGRNASVANEKIWNTQICDLRKAAGFFHAAKPEAVACSRHRPP